MNQAAAEKLQPFLSAQESLLWAGQPQQGLLFRLLDIFMLPLAAFWLAFTYVMAIDWLSNPHLSWTALVVIPIIVMGLYLAIGRFFVDHLQRKCTFYGITNEKILIVSGVFRRKVRSAALELLTEISMTQRTDGSGTITFGDSFPYAALFAGIAVPTMELYMVTQFFRIPDVAQVYTLINTAQRHGWVSPSD